MTDTPLKWIEKKIKIKDLKDCPFNPRSMSKYDFKRLVNDIEQDGYHKRILIDSDNTIIGGHSRKKALIASGRKTTDEIEVLQASRNLSTTEFKRLNIRDNLGFGDFDMDLLANNFDVGELLDWGMDESLFQLDLDLKQIDEITNDEEKTKCPTCGK